MKNSAQNAAEIAAAKALFDRAHGPEMYLFTTQNDAELRILAALSTGFGENVEFLGRKPEHAFWPLTESRTDQRPIIRRADKHYVFQLDALFRHHIRQMLCVHTMLGSVCPMHMKVNGREFHAATYTTSIGTTHGGSGGPVVDEEGRLVGVSIRKGLTSASGWGIQTTSGGILDRLPTNTGYALSHRLLTELVPGQRH